MAQLSFTTGIQGTPAAAHYHLEGLFTQALLTSGTDSAASFDNGPLQYDLFGSNLTYGAGTGPNILTGGRVDAITVTLQPGYQVFLTNLEFSAEVLHQIATRELDGTDKSGFEKLFSATGWTYLGTDFGDVLLAGARSDWGASLTFDGTDLVVGHYGDDHIYLGDGNDRAYGNAGDDAFFGETGDDTLSGGNRRDHLNGGDGNDSLVGGEGRDTLQGGTGDDILRGGDENDFLTGGAGHDFMMGNAGIDSFFFDDDSDRDAIGDFEPGIDGLQITTNETVTFHENSWGLWLIWGDDAVVLRDVTQAAFDADPGALTIL